MWMRLLKYCASKHTCQEERRAPVCVSYFTLICIITNWVFLIAVKGNPEFLKPKKAAIKTVEKWVSDPTGNTTAKRSRPPRTRNWWGHCWLKPWPRCLTPSSCPCTPWKSTWTRWHPISPCRLPRSSWGTSCWTTQSALQSQVFSVGCRFGRACANFSTNSKTQHHLVWPLA